MVWVICLTNRVSWIINRMFQVICFMFSIFSMFSHPGWQESTISGALLKVPGSIASSPFVIFISWSFIAGRLAHLRRFFGLGKMDKVQAAASTCPSEPNFGNKRLTAISSISPTPDTKSECDISVWRLLSFQTFANFTGSRFQFWKMWSQKKRLPKIGQSFQIGGQG